jgi:hypothetical protein
MRTIKNPADPPNHLSFREGISSYLTAVTWIVSIIVGDWKRRFVSRQVFDPE